MGCIDSDKQFYNWVLLKKYMYKVASINPLTN
ncbi:hypothetical protein FHS70_002483 [Flammeovirga yaeyamensis]|nr:hypothetical protein [Flammeovirga yaeyamensis]